MRFSRGTWAELQVLRPADALGDDRVFEMTPSGKPGTECTALPERPGWSRSRRSCAIRTALMPSTAAPVLATVREALGHASLATTGRYLHARRERRLPRRLNLITSR